MNVTDMTFAQWLDEWLSLNRYRLSDSTYSSYLMYKDAHYLPFFGGKLMGEITELDVRRFMAQQMKSHSSTTVRKHISVLNLVFTDGLRNESPVRYIKLPPKKRYKPYLIDEQQFGLLHDHIKCTSLSGRDELIFLLAGWCGMRRGEIFALETSDLLQESNKIIIDKAVCINSDSQYIVKKPKSDNGLRTIVCPGSLTSKLRDYIAENDISGRIFDLRPDYFSHRFSNFAKECGLSRVRFHDLRHYHASYLYEKGFPDHYVAERLGHDIQTLKGIYQHIGVYRQKELDDSLLSLYG